MILYVLLIPVSRRPLTILHGLPNTLSPFLCPLSLKFEINLERLTPHDNGLRYAPAFCPLRILFVASRRQPLLQPQGLKDRSSNSPQPSGRPKGFPVAIYAQKFTFDQFFPTVIRRVC